MDTNLEKWENGKMSVIPVIKEGVYINSIERLSVCEAPTEGGNLNDMHVVFPDLFNTVVCFRPV
jgi:hypothetical protein